MKRGFLSVEKFSHTYCQRRECVRICRDGLRTGLKMQNVNLAFIWDRVSLIIMD